MEKFVIFCIVALFAAHQIHSEEHAEETTKREKGPKTASDDINPSTGLNTTKPNITTGGNSEVPVDDPHANELLNTGIVKLVTGDSNKLEVVKINKIWHQTVAGSKYVYEGEFKTGDQNHHCNVTVWHRAWEKESDKLKIKALCDGGKEMKVEGEKEEFKK